MALWCGHVGPDLTCMLYLCHRYRGAVVRVCSLCSRVLVACKVNDVCRFCSQLRQGMLRLLWHHVRLSSAGDAACGVLTLRVSLTDGRMSTIFDRGRNVDIA